MTTTTATHFEDLARQCEADAVAYPDERGEALLEAAARWKQAGDPDRADEVLREVLALGGLDAEYARHQLAEICFERGADADASAHLDALEASGISNTGPANLVAELLEERGDYAAALHWYDLAIGRLGPDRLARIGVPGSHSFDGFLLVGRQQCRQKLGLPADDLDRAADVAEQNRLDFVHLFEQLAAARTRTATVRMLVCQRDQQLEAAQRWPDVFTPNTIGNQPQVEQQLQDLRAQGCSTFVVVPLDVEEFARYLARTGGDPADDDVRLGYMAEAADRGHLLPWPPSRNSPCWCASGRKYKKCCAAPRPTTP